ncbi:MAG: HNH endonuclease [Deltaproteobacteria bacterium]|nr:HNH endonuclease [Deltaproteobacteria bacterium]
MPPIESPGDLRPSSWDPRDLEIMPAWLDFAPNDEPIKGDDRDPAAQVLDRELGPVVGMEAACRLIQARLMAVFLSRRLWLPLGFVRVRDYSAERLGLAARTLEEDARAVQALEALPQIEAAFLERRISWTHVRLLITVATAEDEETWLEFACSHSTRDLEAFVKNGARPMEQSNGESDDAGNASAEASRQPADAEDTDPMLLWTIRCSREGRRLWRATCEMASRVAGTQLARWQAAECIGAEAMSAAPHMPAPPQDAHEEWSSARQDAAAESAHTRSEQYIGAFEEEFAAAEGFPYLDPVQSGPALPDELEALIDDIDGADAHELDRRLRMVRTAMQRIDWQLGTILRCVVDHKLYRELGFASFKLYVEARLGISARKAWSLVRLERQSSARCPELRLAYRRGEISWLAATTLLPVITETYQREWVERAAQVTLQRLTDEVSWALDRRDEPHGEQCQPPPPIDLDVSADAASRVDEHQVRMRAQAASQEVPDPLGSGYAVGATIALHAPVSVIGLLEDAIEGHRARGEQRWRAFERVLAHAFLCWNSQPRHRDRVFERDSWTCQVPACTSRCHLHDHHVIFLSRGGGNGLENRVTVCAGHHLHGVHAGIIRACGSAPHAIVWELGCLRRTRPLLRTLGDRYLDDREER